MNAETFNSRFPVGTPVLAYPACRPEDCPNDKRLVTRTRSEAQVLGGHADVVWVEGYSSCIALSHVDVVTEAEYERLAEARAAWRWLTEGKRGADDEQAEPSHADPCRWPSSPDCTCGGAS